MNYSSSDEKINMYLDELANEYKQLLLNKLVNESESTERLSVTELIRIDNEIKKPLIIDTYEKDMKRKKMYVIVGIIYFIVGQLFISILDFLPNFNLTVNYGLIRNNNFMQDIAPLMGKIISYIGVIVGVMGYLFSDRKSNKMKIRKDFNKKVLEYDVIERWRTLEGLASDLNVSDKKEIRSSISIIDILKYNRIISDKELVELRKFLKIRNVIVHGGSEPYSLNEIEELLNSINKVLRKLEKIR